EWEDAMRRRVLTLLLVAAVVGLGTTACDVRVAGRRCTVNGATAQDATHVLVCTKGRWSRTITKGQAALILLSVIQSKTPVDVDAGNGHSCATMQNGDVKCWGFNSSGQLGDGTTTNSGRPVLVLGANVNGLNSVATIGGTVLAGDIDVGAEFGCSRRASKFKASDTSTLSCWGYNGFGQLGDGSTTNALTPKSVAVGTGVLDAATGTVHSCAAIEFGGVKCWGQNTAGQLGDGSTSAKSSPTPVTGITSASVVTAGNGHSCAGSGSTIWCWGANGSGQLGDGTTTNRTAPVAVASIAAERVEAGGDSTCAVFPNRTVACWGANGSGQLGDGTTTSRSVPTAVGGLSDVAEVSVGHDHTCAVVGDVSAGAGTVRCWGNNDRGQLGNGTTTASSTPVAVPGLTKVTDVAAGFGHTCAVSDQRVWCWGRNDFGQLGDTSTTDRLIPVVTPT
ncbi:MAG TPA: hypothetical protein PLV93_14470, partial [Microthrixaceae bacterium]|nr:hypothetical protein [Microthrixaceae bacterium]